MVQTATLPLMLKQLRLSSIAHHWQTLFGKAECNGWDSAQYLSALCEQELADRYSQRIARYRKESHLPVGKSLASFDFAQVPGLARGQIEALAGSSDWTRQTRNVLLFGASGVGKTPSGRRHRPWADQRRRGIVSPSTAGTVDQSDVVSDGCKDPKKKRAQCKRDYPTYKHILIHGLPLDISACAENRRTAPRDLFGLSRGMPMTNLPGSAGSYFTPHHRNVFG